LAARTDEIRFEVASILALPFGDGAFDVAYTTRALINLPTWEEQQKAILESLRVVRPSGTLVISEGFWEPLCLLNTLRLLFRLEPLVEHDFNRYLKKAKLEAWLRELKVTFEARLPR
jgi:ubiquinone/menaquinone biosynthesis C-methylase UbiE